LVGRQAFSQTEESESLENPRLAEVSEGIETSFCSESSQYDF